MLNAHPTGELTEPNARQSFEVRDRESFFGAQARNHRAIWRISVLCALAAALMGIPLALIITPLLHGMALIISSSIWFRRWPSPPACLRHKWCSWTHPGRMPGSLARRSRMRGSLCRAASCEAANGPEGVRKTEELQPDVVVLDVTMPVFGGIEAAARIRRVASKPRIVFLSQHKLAGVAQAALASGGHAYVVKSAASTDLVAAINAAVSGERFVSPLH